MIKLGIISCPQLSRAVELFAAMARGSDEAEGNLFY